MAIKADEVQIRIKLFGLFRTDRFHEEVRHYPCGTRVETVVRDLRLPEHLLGIVVINDKHARTDTLLYDGDTLSLLPLLDGG